VGALGQSLDVMTEAGGLPFGGVGAILAVVMIVALRLMLPRKDLRVVQVPFVMLVAHIALAVVAILLPDGLGQHVCSLVALLLILVTLARLGFVLLVDTIAARRITQPIPKIFRDILQGLVYSGAVLITLRAAGAQLDALLTTSALLTAVVGLSLQDTLGNLFAGLSIQAQRPFEVDDWIQFDEREDWVGRVVEINWRATKVSTLDDVEVVIPNGLLARAPIKNFTKPSIASRRSVFVVVPREHSPFRVREVIERGVREVPGVLSEPKVSVITRNFTDRGLEYWVRFHIEDFPARESIDGRVRDRIWYALRRAGVEIAHPTHDVDVRHDDEALKKRQDGAAMAGRVQALRAVEFCASLSDEQILGLAQGSEVRPYAPGEAIVHEGDQGTELFIIDRGDVIVSVGDRGGTVEVARLSPPSFFGEMSVMTGEPRRATVRALTDTSLLVVGKDAFKEILAAAPELAEVLSLALAERQEALSSAASKPAGRKVVNDAVEERSGQLLGRIREFFSL